MQEILPMSHTSYWYGEGNGTPLQYSCLENPMDGGAWWAAVHGVAKSRKRLHFHFHTVEKEMTTHSSVLAWRIPRTVEPRGLPSMESHRVRHDWSNLAAVATDNVVIYCLILNLFLLFCAKSCKIWSVKGGINIFMYTTQQTKLYPHVLNDLSNTDIYFSLT